MPYGPLPPFARILLIGLFQVLLCIECCGIHRSFGVQVSKVRSLTMDSLEPEQRKLMIALGNRLVNSIYLAHLPNANIVPPPPRPTSSRLMKFVLRSLQGYCDL